MYVKAESLMVVNGQKGKPFQMEKIVHWGCLVTPYLYLFMANPLGYMISNPSYGIEGFIFLNGTQMLDQMFVDDTMLFLKGNLDKFFRCFMKL